MFFVYLSDEKFVKKRDFCFLKIIKNMAADFKISKMWLTIFNIFKKGRFCIFINLKNFKKYLWLLKFLKYCFLTIILYQKCCFCDYELKVSKNLFIKFAKLYLWISK